MKRSSLPPVPPRQSRPQSSASAAQVPSPSAHDSEDFADIDDSHSDVGFERSTVLLYESVHQPANKLADMPGGSSSTGGGNKGPLPYAMYEPAYAQQQQGVLRSVLPDETTVTAAGWSGGSVFPAPDAPYSHTVLHPHQQSHLMPPPYLGAAPARPPFPVCSLSVLGPSTTAEGVPEAPSAPRYSPSTTVAESATGTSAKTAASTEVLEVPLHAPRLRVPSNLPLEQTTLLDLLATAVVQGGPTTEEEIVKREVGRGNPAFAFLGEKFNHPCMLYYRWRLYSLLQGDTLLSWRTQPFQIEEARRAYVWVPPPALKVGPESLAGLHQPELLDTALATGSTGDAGAAVGGADDEDGADVIVRTASRRRRRHHRSRDSEGETKCKRSRPEAEDEGGHGSRRHSGSSSSGSSMQSSSSNSSESDTEQTELKGSGAASAQHAGGDETSRAKCQTTGPSLAGTSVEPPSSEAAADAARLRLPPPSAQWISRQCTAHRHVFAILQPHLLEKWTALLNPYAIADAATVGGHDVATLCQRWLRRDEVASRMVFAIRHADAIHHLLSVLLDAVVKVAYVATARSRQQPAASVDALDSNVYCVEAVWYLFVLHDIVMNASNMPETSAASATSLNKSASSRQQPAALQSQQAPSTAAGTMSGAASAGRADADEELFASEGGPEALEALYDAFRRRHLSTRTGTSTPPSPVAAAGAAAATTAVSPSSALGSTPRPRRRQRHPQRRSPYERCGDALEMILPTLIEACTAIALAVSMDKERHRSQAAATGLAAAAQVRHFKVLPPQQQHQHQQQSKTRDKSKVAEHEPMMASPSPTLHVGGGPALSLRLDAGCDATGSLSSRSTLALFSSSAEGSGSTAAEVGADTTAPSTSSAPAVMLLHWLKTFLIVWMNVEQPLQPPPSPSAGAGMAARAVAAPGTAWPDCQADAADMPDVSLTYHVDPQHASLLGLDAASQQQRNVYHQPPLLSARACAILKDRYSFLF
ncbi:hypothetical protein GH5_07974 [Leishmania sp. Ghana 2012 LV757]|uniref:hypothetical protein n=1 Tax=Leishmania sp. Ghana 2012 LV757 TaxID=2803181 RepID=UPI001B7C50C0|nr:hypothetical protein GH5_07974 [Leishmania sp. Ghana 2012 LV757]